MALPATDAFTTGSSAPLQTYSASWTINNGAFQASGGSTDVVFANSAGVECGAHWNADAFGNDQYAQVALARTIPGSVGWMGPSVRAHASAASWYGFYARGAAADTQMYKMVAGTWTQIGGNGGASWVANDIIRLEVSGTTLTPKKNGSVYSSIGAQTDSSLSSGSGGLAGFGNSGTSDCCGDNWEAGNLAGAGGLPFFMQIDLMIAGMQALAGDMQ